MEFTCPECGGSQDIPLTVDTYEVVCEHCPATFQVPRKRRKNKRELREWTSCVNIRVGIRAKGEELVVGWTVQSAEKGNQYLEKRSVVVDVSEHPEKMKWYVAVFKVLQHVGKYREARIWVKDTNVIQHLDGGFEVGDDDLRAAMKAKIIERADEQFGVCEFCEADNVGRDITQMISA